MLKSVFTNFSTSFVLLLVANTTLGEHIPEATKHIPWQRATSPRDWIFPRDHGAHPEYRTEWWYIVGHLFTEDGRRFGVQITFFRHGISSKGRNPVTQKRSAWRTDDVHFAHFAIADEQGQNYFHAERITRPVHGRAWAHTDTLDVHNSGWWLRCEPSACGQGTSDDPFRAEFFAEDNRVSAHIRLQAIKPLVFQGERGLSQKSSDTGNASHYYSMTRLQATGKINIRENNFSVKGLCWMDREFSTSALGTEQRGWDWFAIQLDDNREIMLYRMRTADGGYDPLSKGLYIEPNGAASVLSATEYSVLATGSWRSKKTGGLYPSGWRIQIPSKNMTLNIDPILANQEMILKGFGGLAYWEGACRVVGTYKEQKITGSAYVELTGYAGDITEAMRR